ncbi:hypothetical protein NESM_000568300 [Novymonas esmeraldas]|uniref:Uncharacterized protein n=1 Tax=Novymonas esmeraldas TaxID=1808958 RepID=A0AAW0EQE0_9TRYP
MASAAGAAAAAAVASFSEESAIVLDKWLYDVCGEEELQFPSHRRQQFAPYLERLRRVAKTRQFVANTFDYPSRSGTREVLVLQKTLEALAAREQAVRHEIEEVLDNVGQLRRTLEERTMGASAIVEEEAAHAASEAAAAAEKQRIGAAAAAAPATAPQRLGYAPLDSPAVKSAATPARSATSTPRPPSVEDEAAGDGGDTASTTASAPQSFSAVARAVRRDDYEKKKALALRYVAEVQSKTDDMARQRTEMAQRHTRLLVDKEQLDKEYEALQTTEELVVARHQETESRRNEEALRVREETSLYAAEEAAFAAAWAECVARLEAEPAVALSVAEAEASEDAALRSSEASPPPSPAPQMPSLSPPSTTPLSPPSTPTLSHRTDRDGAVDGDADAAAAAAAAGAAASLSDAAPALSSAAALPGENSDEEGSSRRETLSSDPPGADVSSAAPPPPPPPPPPPLPTPPRKRQALDVLRQRLSEVGTRAATHRRHLMNESQMHLGRFRQSQQRLKDWQEMVAQLHRTHHQLRGQVDTIHTVLSDTAERLEAASAAPAAQLSRLNTLLRERSYETYQFYMGSGEAAAMDLLFDANADEELRALQRPAPSTTAAGGGGDVTPVRGGTSASASLSATPTRQSSVASAYHSHDYASSPPSAVHTPPRRNGAAGNGHTIPNSIDAPHRHRSRYELVRHLQRWEAVLLTERLAIVKAAHMVPGPYSGAGANTKRVDGFSATQAYHGLRALLLQQRTSATTASSTQ